MKRRLCNLLYHWIDERGRIPRWVRWIWKKAHWCWDMDGLLIMDNPEDCFCGHSIQPTVLCSCCGIASERRYTNGLGVCDGCVPEDNDSPF